MFYLSWLDQQASIRYIIMMTIPVAPFINVDEL